MNKTATILITLNYWLEDIRTLKQETKDHEENMLSYLLEIAEQEVLQRIDNYNSPKLRVVSGKDASL